ncbi:MAG TPA: hypothetical protein VD962_11460 [Rubricoccaceae bacterium]|nr:hypothetical protein [Rubricoccaceae bacterium]
MADDLDTNLPGGSMAGGGDEEGGATGDDVTRDDPGGGGAAELAALAITDEPPAGMTDDDTDEYVRDELAVGPERSRGDRGNLGAAADDATKNDPGSGHSAGDAPEGGSGNSGMVSGTDYGTSANS